MTPPAPDGTLLSGHARIAGILGWPASHSRSPRLHGLWLRRHGVDGAYIPLPVRPERFAQAVRSLADLGFRGANVTIPHKEAAFAVCDRVDATAHRAGAVNTLVFRDGVIEGSNTDGWGFLQNCAEAAPGWTPDAGPVVILGAGGSARAIAAALLDASCPRVVLVNRSPARAEALARALGGPIEVAESPPLAGAAMLVNTTSLGMQGQPPLEIDLAPLPAAAVVADIVYVPRETPLLAAARARGLAAVEGLGMLLHQARPGFEAWFGVTPRVDDELRAVVGGDIPLHAPDRGAGEEQSPPPQRRA
ncbi:shikimate dehydrogenase [Roseicella aerolata]